MDYRCVEPTPFSTCSLHWFEAILLSSVMLLLLLVWPLDIITVLVFPGIRLVANSIGHMNDAMFPGKAPSQCLTACQRHTAHHIRWVGNYGFYSPWLDRLLGTRGSPRGPRATLRCGKDSPLKNPACRAAQGRARDSVTVSFEFNRAFGLDYSRAMPDAYDRCVACFGP